MRDIFDSLGRRLGRDSGATTPSGTGVVDLGIAGIEGAVLVAKGAYGDIYRARQPDFGRIVAIKLLTGAVDAEAVKLFERERRTMGSVSSHPNIVTVLDGGVTKQGVPYLVMEYSEGGSLEALMARRRLDVQEAGGVGVRIARALDAAHRAGIVHGDVKPANILISGYGEPMLTDFGVARMLGATVSAAISSINTSLAHAAPELLSTGTPSVQADVYALASTVDAAMRGHDAFGARSGERLEAVVRRIIDQPLPDPREYGAPDAVADLLVRATSKDPGQRPGSAADFGASLETAIRRAGYHTVTISVSVDVPDSASPGSNPIVRDVIVNPGETIAISRDALPPITDDREPPLSLPVAATPASPPRPRRRKQRLDTRLIWALGIAVVIAVLAIALANRSGDVSQAADTQPNEASPTTIAEPTSTTQGTVAPLPVIIAVELDMCRIADGISPLPFPPSRAIVNRMLAADGAYSACRWSVPYPTMVLIAFDDPGDLPVSAGELTTLLGSMGIDSDAFSSRTAKTAATADGMPILAVLLRKNAPSAELATLDGEQIEGLAVQAADKVDALTEPMLTVPEDGVCARAAATGFLGDVFDAAPRGVRIMGTDPDVDACVWADADILVSVVTAPDDSTIPTDSAARAAFLETYGAVMERPSLRMIQTLTTASGESAAITLLLAKNVDDVETDRLRSVMGDVLDGLIPQS